MNTRVLVVEDEADIANLVKHTLERDGDLSVEIVGSGPEALERVAAEVPSLIVLDLNLPVLTGFEVCRILRSRPATARVPIIMLTARATESDRVSGLELGADDYVTKPFSAAELLARVRAGLRRASRGADTLPLLSLGETCIDLARRVARGPGGTVHLTPLEYRVLDCLARQSGMIVTARQLLREVWGPDRAGDSGALRVCVKGLRDKLEPDPRRPQFLVTEPGIGYRLRPGDQGEG
mgnify:CR=1 FL=1